MNWVSTTSPVGMWAMTSRLPPSEVTIRSRVPICMSDCFSIFERHGWETPSSSASSCCGAELGQQHFLLQFAHTSFGALALGGSQLIAERLELGNFKWGMGSVELGM